MERGENFTMMKKKGIFLVLIMICLCLAACGQSTGSLPDEENNTIPDEDNANTDENAFYEEYEAIIEKYRTALEEDWDPERCMQEEVNYMLGLYSSDTKPDDIGYSITDIDGDGTAELIIGAAESMKEEFNNKLVYDLYTFKDGKAILVFGSLERNRLFWIGGDKFANVGSNGWDDSVDTVLQFRDYALEDTGETSTPEDYRQMELTPFSK